MTLEERIAKLEQQMPFHRHIAAAIVDLPSGSGAVDSVDGRTGAVTLTDLYDPSGEAATAVSGHESTYDHDAYDTHIGAAAPHSGHATLSSGKVPTSELGSGTADGTTFLRGDQTYATPAGAGDVVGPAGATGDHLAVFDGATGKAIKDGGSVPAGVQYGAQSSRPAASAVPAGTLYEPTDGYYPAISTGSAWKVRPIPGVEVTDPPATGTFTAVNAGAETTFAADGDGLMLTQNGAATTSTFMVAELKSLPAAPYSLVVGFDLGYVHPVNYGAIGICLTDGVDKDASLVTDFAVGWFTAGLSLLFAKLTKLNAGGHTNYTGSPALASWPVTERRFFLRLRDDNTNRYYEISRDLRNFATLFSVGRTDYLTPTHGGILIGQGSTSVAGTQLRAQAKIFHWSLG